ncbi:MAG: protein kinase [Polyangiaceae bacterium]|nr:protein kinase [Polyangiaceae bacterium]
MSERGGPIDVGSTVAEKLRVVRLMGAGGTGAVYEVEHLITKTRQALKLLHPRYADHPATRERFLREASASGRIKSPHIVEALDAGTLPSGELFLVMELLQGQPLSEVLEHEGKLSFEWAADIAAQAADGVQAAHDAGIIHRDLKTDNLFVVDMPDGRPFVKILDFGISKFDPTRTRDLRLTREGSFLGTPYYTSPEQFLSQGVDERTDVYSLGVVLYECLTGNKPFDAESFEGLAAAVIQGQYVPIHELRPETRPELERLVATAMALSRDDRFGSAAEMATALRILYPSTPWARTSTPPRSARPRSAAPTADSARAATSWAPSAPPDGASAGGGYHSHARQEVHPVNTTTHAGILSHSDPVSAHAVPSRKRRLLTIAAIGLAVAVLAGASLLLRSRTPQASVGPAPADAPTPGAAPLASQSPPPSAQTVPVAPPASTTAAPSGRAAPQAVSARRRGGPTTPPDAGSASSAAAPAAEPQTAPLAHPSSTAVTPAKRAGLKENPFSR